RRVRGRRRRPGARADRGGGRAQCRPPRHDRRRRSRRPVRRRAMNRRIAVLISGRGTNLQSIIDATASGALNAAIAVVLSNRGDAFGLTRAREGGIYALHLAPRAHADRDAYDRAIVEALKARDVALV